MCFGLTLGVPHLAFYLVLRELSPSDVMETKPVVALISYQEYKRTSSEDFSSAGLPACLVSTEHHLLATSGTDFNWLVDRSLNAQLNTF